MFVFAVTFVIVTCPPVLAPPVIARRVTLFVSRFNPKASFVPMVMAAPVVLPPSRIAPETEGEAHVPSPRQNVDALADVPLFRFVTGKFPVTWLPERFTAARVITCPEIVM